MTLHIIVTDHRRVTRDLYVSPIESPDFTEAELAWFRSPIQEGYHDGH